MYPGAIAFTVGRFGVSSLLALGNPKIKSVKMEDVVDPAPSQRLEQSSFYRELLAQAKKP